MKNILIVGGNSGIGKTLVNKLKGKANIYCASRNPEEIEGIKDYKTWDVLDENLDTSWLPEELHGLVYCPGTIDLKPISGLDVEDFKKDMEINYLGAVNVIKHALKPLKKSGDAQVITFSTVAVGRGMPFHASIAGAKGAVEGLTRSLAAELAPKVKVNAIAPSLTNTPLAKNLLSTESRVESAKERHPLKRYGETDDIANMAEYLVLQDKGWITGQIFGVDGGLSAI
ncbi:MAG: SDR family oxidoreductase [Saprospiraceae bacterium]|nr:SDR family oxidoreductase [Saprospiraceae bacterium]